MGMQEIPQAQAGSLLQRCWRGLGPGLVTGAADDDPSGIATHSQIGAQFGYALSWTFVLSFPLMVVIQEVAAQIGCVTGRGIAHNLRRHYPPWALRSVVTLLLVANIVNLGADLGAMGAALQLLIGGPEQLYTLLFGVVCILLEVWLSYPRYAAVLKWTTLSLFSYVAVVFVADVPWDTALKSLLIPRIDLTGPSAMAMVAILGTTISPYLFFWQAGQEIEEQHRHHAKPLCIAPRQAGPELRRIRVDTLVGMAFSSVISVAIVFAAAATLNAHGITDIATSAQAAEALRPIAGDFAFILFAAGIIGTGLLAVPVLAGSAAYAVAESMNWPIGHGLVPRHAKGFYAIITVSTALGVALGFTPIDPIKALVATAVINGVVAVPIMVVMMRMAARPDIMGPFVITRRLRRLGWAATVAMGIAVAGMLVSYVV